MDPNIIPGKLRLKRELGFKKMKKLFEKKEKRKITDRKSVFEKIKQNEIKELDATDIPIPKVGDTDKVIEECEEKIKEDKASKELEQLFNSMTSSEKLFYKKKMQKLPEKISKLARTSFKEKYQQYYKALTKLPEHNDIPKVGPG